MKKRLRLVLLVGLGLLVPFVCYSADRTGPFRVRIVDARTGAGIPNAQVTLDSGAVGTTAFDGSVVFWLNMWPMNGAVRSTVEQRGITTTAELRVTRGGLVVLAVPAP